MKTITKNGYEITVVDRAEQYHDKKFEYRRGVSSCLTGIFDRLLILRSVNGALINVEIKEGKQVQSELKDDAQNYLSCMKSVFART